MNVAIPIQTQDYLIEELITLEKIEELIKLKDSITRWVPKELLNEQNYNQVEMIEKYLSKNKVVA